MKLVDASSYFDRTPILDPVTGAKLFLGQLDNYDDSKRDASAAYRRVLSVRPGTAVPPVIKAFGSFWLVGTSEIDGLWEEHRAKYVLQRATSGVYVGGLSEYLASATPTPVWASEFWEKDMKQLAASSTSPQKYQIYLPQGTSAPTRGVVWRAGVAYLILSVHSPASDFVLAECEKLEFGVATATLTARSYNPVTGTYSSSAPATAACQRIRWEALFDYTTQADAKFQEGDCTLALPSGTVITTAHTLTLSGLAWTPLSVDEANGVVLVHGRPA